MYVIILTLRLKAEGMYERAAAISVFNNDIPTAISILSEGSTTRVNGNLHQGTSIILNGISVSNEGQNLTFSGYCLSWQKEN